MYVIGTAGHVDHGKSTLVQALTGIDPDRLAEEKERGLTIDLGFAWLTLPSGREVSIVDVPGHERFIKNMLAGAGGVDLALLVIAADEGPMPQTYEHLAILDRLDVPSGIAVVTKADLVESDYLELVVAEVEDVLAGSRLSGAPVVTVSGATREGLDTLLATLDAALDSVPRKRDLQRARLPVDRAFTVQGFGTVVTGTLLDGALELGQEVELQPGRLRARVRGLQRHRSKVDRLEPGTRAAVNLAGVPVEAVHRGMVVAAPGAVGPVRAMDVYLEAAAVMRTPLPHDAVVTLLCATSETQARVRLLDAEVLDPGGACWAQLVLESPVAAVAGDRCILRSSDQTLAGGRILAVNPRRHRRHHPQTIATLERLLAGSPEARLNERLLEGPLGIERAGAFLGLPAAEVEERAGALSQAGQLLLRNRVLYGIPWADARARRLKELAAEYLEEHPLRRAVPREHLRSRLRLDPDAFDVVVGRATASFGMEDLGRPGLAPTGHRPVLNPVQERAVDAFLGALKASPYSPPTDELPAADLLAYLESEGKVVVTRAGVVFDAAVFDEMVAATRRRLDEGREVSLAEVRDLFSTSRKYAQAFLEHLDAIGLTRRVGDARVLLRG